MKRDLPTLLLLVVPLYFLSCRQGTESVSEKYFRLLNNRQTDSLQDLLAKNFKVTLTYTRYSYNRSDFFNTYMKILRENDERSRILKTISDKEPRRFLVEDSSAYLKCLGVMNPNWVVTVKSKGGEVTEVIIDTTETSRKYFSDVKEKNDKFLTWLRERYIYAYPAVLYDTPGLLLKRLKEFKAGDK